MKNIFVYARYPKLKLLCVKFILSYLNLFILNPYIHSTSFHFSSYVGLVWQNIVGVYWLKNFAIYLESENLFSHGHSFFIFRLNSKGLDQINEVFMSCIRFNEPNYFCNKSSHTTTFAPKWNKYIIRNNQQPSSQQSPT